MGANGLLHCGLPGTALPSENAHFELFGYHQHEFPGRGYLEALGAGIEASDGETAFLAHLSMLEARNNSLLLVKDRPRLSDEEAAPFLQSVAEYRHENISCRLTQTKSVDAILVLGPDSSHRVTDTLPFFDGQPLIEPQPLAECRHDPLARQTAAALKSYLVWCHRTLSRHPLNMERQQQGRRPLNGLVTLRPGRKITVENFRQRWGMRGLSISSGLLYRGLGRFLGLAVRQTEDIGNPGRDFEERLQLALAMRQSHDFIHVHTKAPDDAAHTKNYRTKVEVIESLDRGIGRIIDSLLDVNTLLIITSDHSTPSSGPLIHSGEPVPIAMVGSGVRQDKVVRFNEVDCADGILGFMQGGNLMHTVLNGLDRIKLVGLRDTPADQPFWPGTRTPFRLE